jgi:mRNA interferase RelE/StbE
MPYRFAVSAIKDLERIPPEIRSIITQKIDYYSDAENPLIFAKRLKKSEHGSYRFRIGDYRAIFDVRGNTIIILRIGHRKEIYK